MMTVEELTAAGYRIEIHDKRWAVLVHAQSIVFSPDIHPPIHTRYTLIAAGSRLLPNQIEPAECEEICRRVATLHYVETKLKS